MSVKLEMLRVFQVVAVQGSLGRAADVLGRTPSAVSMMLSQLQDHLGGPLFETDRKSRLTPLGRLVLGEADRALDAFDRSTAAILRHAKSTAGLVRIAAVPSATVTLLPAVIARFRKERPDVRLEIGDVDSAAVRRRVYMDHADIGIISTAPDEEVDGEVIQRDQLGIVCRRDGAISRLGRISDAPSWTLLREEALIANPLCNLVDSDVMPELLNSCNLEAKNTSALLGFVHSGLGVTILPQSAVQGADAALDFIVPQNPVSWRNLSKIRFRDRHLSPAAQIFWDMIKT